MNFRQSNKLVLPYMRMQGVMTQGVRATVSPASMVKFNGGDVVEVYVCNYHKFQQDVGDVGKAKIVYMENMEVDARGNTVWQKGDPLPSTNDFFDKTAHMVIKRKNAVLSTLEMEELAQQVGYASSAQMSNYLNWQHGNRERDYKFMVFELLEFNSTGISQKWTPQLQAVVKCKILQSLQNKSLPCFGKWVDTNLQVNRED